MIKTGTTDDLILGVDPQDSVFRVMRMRRGDYRGAAVEQLPFTTRAFDAEAGFYAEMTDVLAAHFAAKPFASTMAAYLVLPDTTVAADAVNIPVMKRKQMREGLDSELRNLYLNYKDLQIRTWTVKQNKQYVAYAVFSMRKEIMTKCYQSLAAVKLYPKRTTFSAHAALEALLRLRPKLRGRSFVFADIRAGDTHFVIVSKGRVSGFATHPLGYMCLTDDQRSLEYMLTDHDVAELAVLNAKETAKAKMLTVSDDDAEAVAAAVEEQLRAAEPGATEERTADAEREEEGAEEAAATIDESPPADEFDAEDEDEAEKAREAARAIKKIKVLRKMPKRFPKFMSRPLPDTPRGYMSENFRILLKWILLYVASARRAEYVTDPEFVLVNMPGKFAYIVDELNAEEDNGIGFRYFAPQTEGNPDLADNLDLLGITYATRLLF